MANGGERYYGLEDLTATDQVVRYLIDNYVDGNGDILREEVARSLCDYDLSWEWIQAGVANRYTVEYVGDQIAEKAKLNERGEWPYDQDNDEDDEDDDA